MLLYQILEEDNILIIEPKSPLSPDDFVQLTSEVDLHLIRTEILRGVLIHTRSFPGWENFKGFISHLRFVRDHHRKVEKVALASDSNLAEIIPTFVDHFVRAKVKHFPFDERDTALEWLRSNE